MEQLKEEFNLDDFSYNLVYQYLQLDPAQRKKVREFAYNLVGISKEDVFTALSKIPDTPEELEKLYPPVDVSTRHKMG